MAGTGERPASCAAPGALPGVSAASGPAIPGIEWEIPLTRLCDLIAEVGALDVAALNPGPVTSGDWQRIAYKGGSQQGVLNFTVLATDAAGTDHCIAATFGGDGPLPEDRAVTAFRNVVAAVKDAP